MQAVETEFATIRQHIKDRILSSEMGAYLWSLIDYKDSILVAGTDRYGSRTRLLSALTNFINPNCTIVSVEDKPKLKILQRNWVQTATHPMDEKSETSYLSCFDLVSDALGKRPDYIVRSDSAEDAYMLSQAAYNRQAAVLLGVSADSVVSVIKHLSSPPIDVPGLLIPAYAAIVLQDETPRGPRVVSVTEVLGEDRRTRELVTNEAFSWDPIRDIHDHIRRMYCVEKRAKEKGIDSDKMREDFQRRKTILDWLVKKDIADSDIVETLGRHSTDPENFYKEAVSELMR